MCFASGAEFRAAHEGAVACVVPIVPREHDAGVTMEWVSNGVREDFTHARLLALRKRRIWGSAEGSLEQPFIARFCLSKL